MSSFIELAKLVNGHNVTIIDRWHSHPSYIKALASILAEDINENFKGEAWDKALILFSAHSIPLEFVFPTL